MVNKMNVYYTDKDYATRDELMDIMGNLYILLIKEKLKLNGTSFSN